MEKLKTRKFNSKKHLLTLLAVLVSVVCFAQNLLTYINTANSFFDLLDEKKYAEAQTYFDDSVKDKVSAANLEQIWGQIKGALGNLESVEGAQNKVQGEYQVVILNCKFTKDEQAFQFVFNKSQKLVGFFIVPKKPGSSYKSPAYADTSKYTEQLITISSGKYNLPAMLTLPKDTTNVPLVVLVHGSGPGDMDETIGSNKPFKDIAIGLATKGIATIRYVKRTTLYPQDFMGAFSVKEEVLDDAVAVLDYAKKLPHVNLQKIYVFGHSLGGMLAPRLAQLQPDLKGIILAAAPARKLQDISIEQNNYFYQLANDTTAASKTAQAQIEKKLLDSKSITTNNIQQDSVILGLPASYWADLNAMDQLSIAKKLNTHIFVIQGGNDFQVGMKDYYLWTNSLKGKKNVQTKLYPMLNHLFVFVSEKGTTKQYQEAGNVEQQLIDDLATWITTK